MHLKKTILSTLLIATQALTALSFAHHDWEVVCDNTNTCRIVGYSAENAQLPLSVLLISKAGANQQVKGKVQLGYFGGKEEDILAKFPKSFKLEMKINNKSYGLVSMNKDNLVASLSNTQTLALLGSLKKSSQIIWKTGNYTWKLSDKGSSAVLLKVDEFQKRLGTKKALYKKGNKSEKNVLASKPIPIITAPKLASSKKVTLSSKEMALLEKKLILNKDDCFNGHEVNSKTTLYKLSSTKLLATKMCWMAAYNSGSAYWVINKQAPFNPKLITTEANDYDRGIISANHKGRGIGDCWSYERFVWNGKSFQQSSQGTTGQCRAIAGGGAWDLPSFVSKLKTK